MNIECCQFKLMNFDRCQPKVAFSSIIVCRLKAHFYIKGPLHVAKFAIANNIQVLAQVLAQVFVQVFSSCTRLMHFARSF